MKPEFKEAWETFLAGKWTQTMPTKPGRYLVTDSAGLANVTFGLNGKILQVAEDLNRKLFAVGGDFYGYWWSVPIPEMPPCLVK